MSSFDKTLFPDKRSNIDAKQWLGKYYGKSFLAYSTVKQKFVKLGRKCTNSNDAPFQVVMRENIVFENLCWLTVE